MADLTIEIRARGPNETQYINLGNQLKDELAKQGITVQVPILFSEPLTTTVLVAIGAGISVHILSKVIDRLLGLRAKETGNKTEISVHVEIRNKTYLLPEDQDRLLEEYSEE
ncbi:MAG: hypothetical protein MUP17_04540 [candidate division Zixibacteria bacterium]|jgi:hypothetical protein|nr:hypothetical protein [candidate division Zixibacteria bacterium]